MIGLNCKLFFIFSTSTSQGWSQHQQSTGKGGLHVDSLHVHHGHRNNFNTTHTVVTLIYRVHNIKKPHVENMQTLSFPMERPGIEPAIFSRQGESTSH